MGGIDPWTLAGLAELGYPPGDTTLGPTGRTRPNPYVSIDATWVSLQSRLTPTA